ncbi:MAG: hypothetical protein LBR47_06345 [Spirochaetaceae bacterium]|jgi:hypothetical protein|nr:hypothetical protein [Spirochaetaceae bacterium]
MISAEKPIPTLILPRSGTDSPLVSEMQAKILDDSYIQGAIFRIALVLSNRLVEIKDGFHER